MYSPDVLQRALQERQGAGNPAPADPGMLPPELMQMLGNQQPAMQPIGQSNAMGQMLGGGPPMPQNPAMTPMGGQQQEMDPMQLIMMLLGGQGQ